MPELACREPDSRCQNLSKTVVFAWRQGLQRPLQCSTTTFLTIVRTSSSYSSRQMGVQADTVLVNCDIYTATIRSCDSMSVYSQCKWELNAPTTFACASCQDGHCKMWTSSNMHLRAVMLACCLHASSSRMSKAARGRQKHSRMSKAVKSISRMSKATQGCQKRSRMPKAASWCCRWALTKCTMATERRASRVNP